MDKRVSAMMVIIAGLCHVKSHRAKKRDDFLSEVFLDANNDRPVLHDDAVEPSKGDPCFQRAGMAFAEVCPPLLRRIVCPRSTWSVLKLFYQVKKVEVWSTISHNVKAEGSLDWLILAMLMAFRQSSLT
jgi:hypothetical protein